MRTRFTQLRTRALDAGETRRGEMADASPQPPFAPAAAPPPYRGTKLYWKLIANGTYRLAFTGAMCLAAVAFAVYFVWSGTRQMEPSADRDDALPSTTTPYYDEMMARTDVAARARAYNASVDALRDRGLITPEIAEQARKTRNVFDPAHDAWSPRQAASSRSALFFNQGVTLK